MSKNKIGKTSLRVCEISVFAGIALNCLSCFFGNEVCKLFYTISPVSVTLLLLPLLIVLKRDMSDVLLKEIKFICVLCGFSVLAFAVSLFNGLNLSYVMTAVIGIVTLYAMAHIPFERDFQIVIIIFLSLVSVVLYLLAVNYSRMPLVDKYNYTNSNVMGLLALIVDSYLMVLITNNKIKGKILHLNVIVAFFSFVTITLFGCRSAQLAFLVFLVVGFALPKFFCGKKRTRFVIIAGILFGFIFPFIYLAMFKNGAGNISFPLIEKPWFTGRDVLWRESVEWMSKTPLSLLFGTGSEFVNIPLGYNFHNSYISILVCFGIPAAILYFYSFYRCGELAVLKNTSNHAKSMQLALICMILVVSLVETTIPATTFIWMYGICFIPLTGYSED